jgi:hypothetical protein
MKEILNIMEDEMKGRIMQFQVFLAAMTAVPLLYYLSAVKAIFILTKLVMTHVEWSNRNGR